MIDVMILTSRQSVLPMFAHCFWQYNTTYNICQNNEAAGVKKDPGAIAGAKEDATRQCGSLIELLIYKYTKSHIKAMLNFRQVQFLSLA